VLAAEIEQEVVKFLAELETEIQNITHQESAA
ncbi:exonuclease, partial [Salmonella enterica]|nr:exonuclease [Salmonella enterica]